MKSKILFYGLLFITFQIFGQELLFDKDIELKSIFGDNRNSLPILNKDKNELALFLLDRKQINSLIFNDKYEYIDHYSTNRPEENFDDLIGYSIDLKGYHLIFTNSTKNQFFIKSIDFSLKSDQGKELSINLKDEKYLESISYKNNFYLLTLKKKSSILKIYEISSNEIKNIKEFDFSLYRFSNSDNSTLYDLLIRKFEPFKSVSVIQKIDNNNPNPLDITTNSCKIYYYNDKFYLTLDNNIYNTWLITINLDDYTSAVKYFGQTKINSIEGAFEIKSNSFLFEDYLYQIMGSKVELSLQIKSLRKDSVIKEFRVNEKEEIDFRNTALFQKGGTIVPGDYERELGKTKQILRKISSSKIGVSVSHYHDDLALTVGGIKEVTSTGGYMMTGSGSTISTPQGSISLPPTYHYNPTMYSYNTYTNTRSVYFKTVLEKNGFNHIEKDITKKEAFDKIKNYEDNNDVDMTCKTVFKVDEYYVFGYYKKWDKKYYLRKFTD